jgi:glycerophosphoryl diester phosphodiesterase
VTLVIAHRGWHREHRENTEAAFRAAVELGVDGVELDVRRTADAQCVVHHDPHLEDGRNLVDLTANEVPDWLPTLERALDACAGVTVNVEIKNNPGEPDFDADQLVARQVCRIVAQRQARDRVVVSSFNLETVDRVRATDPAVRTALLAFDASRSVETAVAHGHGGVNPFFALLDQAVVEQANAAGLAVVPWTVDDPERIAELAGWGVHGVITNIPELALDQLR